MCEKVEQLYNRDDRISENKGGMQLSDAIKCFEETSYFCCTNENRCADRSFEIPDESQTSDEYLIIDEANGTLEEYESFFVADESIEYKENLKSKELLGKETSTHGVEVDVSTSCPMHNPKGETISNPSNSPSETVKSQPCLKKLSVQIDMSIVKSPPSLFTSFSSTSCNHKTSNLSIVVSTDTSSPKSAGKNVKSKLPSKNIPVRKSSSELCLTTNDEVYKDVGAGLQNMGNTCFVNATLQCLTYTPIFFDILVSSNDTCSSEGGCITCELTKHINSCFHRDRKAIKPNSILKMLKGIAHHMRWGRQEDAHEFLRYLMDSLHKSFMSGHEKTNSPNESIVQRIFAGELRSQVICEECNQQSDTFDPFLDLCLDVKNSNSITEALVSFVRFETLEGENSYFCARCSKNVKAKKLFSIHKPPHILTIQLKRYGMSEGKVTRHINFPSRLDLQPYMSQFVPDSLEKLDEVKETKSDTKECMYNLYAVLVHDGSSTNSGHYYCYIRTKRGSWYCMNDHMVKLSSIADVLSSEAYLLFYCEDPITFGIEEPHNKTPFKMVSPSSCSNLTLNSSFNMSSKVTCRGGRLQTSPSSSPLPSPTLTQSETKTSSTTPSSSKQPKSFSRVLQHRAKSSAATYRYKRLRLNAEKLRAAKSESSNRTNNSVNNVKTPPVTRVVAEETNKESCKTRTKLNTAAYKRNNCSVNCQIIKKETRVQPKVSNNKPLIPQSLMEILKPQKVKQTLEGEPNKPFKIPLKKSSKDETPTSPEQKVDHDVTAKVKLTQTDSPEQTSKSPDPHPATTKTPTSRSVQPSKSCDMSPNLSSQEPLNKTSIQLRPRKSRLTVAPPSMPAVTSSPSTPLVSATTNLLSSSPPAPVQSPSKAHSSQPNNTEHRKFRKRKHSNCEEPSKCLAATSRRARQSLKTVQQPPSKKDKCIVAPIKLRKVAVTEDGKSLYKIV